MTTERLTIRPFDQLPQWDQFVVDHPCGNLFHTRAMIEAYRQTPRCEPMAIAALQPCGAIASLMVATRISIGDVWPDRFSARSVLFAEPISVPGAIGQRATEQLVAEHDRCVADYVVFSEIRPTSLCDPHANVYQSAGYERIPYSNFELDLRQPIEDILANMNPKRRCNIRSNERRGLTVRQADPIRELSTFYDHLLFTHHRSQVPLPSRRLFEGLFASLTPSQYRLSIAELDGKPIASSCHLFFGGRVYWWRAGTYRIPGIYAQASLVWETIQYAASQGYRVYDFAGAGWGGDVYGPGIFKSKFGGQHVDVGRYRKYSSKWRMKMAEVGYRFARPMLRPDGLLKSFPRSTKHDRSGLSADKML